MNYKLLKFNIGNKEQQEQERCFCELRNICLEKDIDKYKTLPSYRLKLMTNIILCGNFNVEEAFKLSECGEGIINTLHTAKYIKSSNLSEEYL